MASQSRPRRLELQPPNVVDSQGVEVPNPEKVQDLYDLRALMSIYGGGRRLGEGLAERKLRSSGKPRALWEARGSYGKPPSNSRTFVLGHH